MNGQRVTAFGVTALGLVLYFIAIPLGVVEPSNITHLALAPRFWPRVISVIIFLMGVLLLIRKPLASGQREDAKSCGSPIASVTGFMVVFSALLGFYVLIPALGMVLPAMVLIFGMMRFAGETRFGLASVISILVPLLLYFFFAKVANIPIPLGVFESLRG